MLEVKSFEDVMTHLRASDDGIEWTQHTTEKGTPYAVGVRKADLEGASEQGPPEDGAREGGALKDSQPNASFAMDAGPPPMRCVYVDWVDGDETWKNAASDVQDLGISKYRFYTHWYLPYYRLDFHNTKGWEWRFVDQRDRYSVLTVLDRDHFLTIWPGGLYTPEIRRVCTP